MPVTSGSAELINEPRVILETPLTTVKETTVPLPPTINDLSNYKQFAPIVEALGNHYLNPINPTNVRELVAYLAQPNPTHQDAHLEWKRYALAEGLNELSIKSPALVLNAIRNNQLLTGLDYILATVASDLRGPAQEHNIFAKGAVVDILISLATHENMRNDLTRILDSHYTLKDDLYRIANLTVTPRDFREQRLFDEVSQTQNRARLLIDVLKLRPAPPKKKYHHLK